MGEIIGIAVTLLVLSGIGTGVAVAERRKWRLPEDDGIVWNTAIERRMGGELNGK